MSQDLPLTFDAALWEEKLLLDIDPCVICSYEPKDPKIWPRLVVRSRKKAFTNIQVEQVLAVFLYQLELQRAYVSIFDFRLYRYPSMYQVYRCMSWAKARKKEFDKYLRCSAVVLRNNYWSTPGWSIVELCKLCDVSEHPMLVAHDMPTALEFIESVYKESGEGQKLNLHSRSVASLSSNYCTMGEFYDMDEVDDGGPSSPVPTPNTLSERCSKQNSFYHREDLQQDYSKMRDRNKEVKHAITWEELLDIPAAYARFGGNKPNELPTFHVLVKNASVRSGDVELVEKALLTLLAKETHFKAVYDARDFKVPAMSYVYRLGTFVSENAAAYERNLKISAVILGQNFWSNAARKIVDLSMTLNPPPCPVLICHTDAAAEAFFEEKLGPVQVQDEDLSAEPELPVEAAVEAPDQAQDEQPTIAEVGDPLRRSGTYLQRRTSGRISSRFITLDSFKSFDELESEDGDGSDAFRRISFKEVQGDLAGGEEGKELAKKTYFSLPELWGASKEVKVEDTRFDDSPKRAHGTTSIAGFSIMNCNLGAPALADNTKGSTNRFSAATTSTKVNETNGKPGDNQCVMM